MKAILRCEHDEHLVQVVTTESGRRLSWCRPCGAKRMDDHPWTPPSYVRDEVAVFARAMETKLRANDHKGGWEDADLLWLLSRLEQEVRELKRAVGEAQYPVGAVLDEAADVANFAMMIADVAGELR